MSTRSASHKIHSGGLGDVGESGIVTWTYLEDLALTKAEDSPEF